MQVDFNTLVELYTCTQFSRFKINDRTNVLHIFFAAVVVVVVVG